MMNKRRISERRSDGPPNIIRIICLANSRKYNGRCVAGREIHKGTPGEWIRIVSAREHDEVSDEERCYEEGPDPCVPDVIDIPVLKRRPKGFQRENWLLDPAYHWSKVGVASWGGLHRLLEPEGPLWVNGFDTRKGSNDRIPVAQAQRLNTSLRLIKVERLEFTVGSVDRGFGKVDRRVRGRFRLHGVEYDLTVTDPIYEGRFVGRPDGKYSIGECFLTISLSEPFEGFSYKLIATILEPGQGGSTCRA